ncbi:hypothetical protein [Agaribacterium sp. ZY112]|uniref:hypothetical protein n=1 Tax=Agaribacterium sp. ZY112 TaxID=3233574 RepID=UPI003523DE0D
MLKITAILLFSYLFGVLSCYGVVRHLSSYPEGVTPLVTSKSAGAKYQGEARNARKSKQNLALTNALLQSGSAQEVSNFDGWELSYTSAFDHIKIVHPELYERVIRSMGELLLSELFTELATVDPSEASLVLVQIPSGELRNTMFDRLLIAWRYSDVDSLFTWLHDLDGLVPDYVFNDSVYDTLLYLADKNPQTAEENLDLITNHGSQEEVLLALANGWAKQNIDDALNWLESLDSSILTEQFRLSLITSIISTYAGDSPRAAAKLLADQNNDEMKQQLTPMLIESISRESMDDAFLMLQETDDAKTRAMSLFRLSEAGLSSPELLLNTLISDPEVLLLGDQGGVLLTTIVDSIAAQNPELISRQITNFPLQLQAEVAAYTATQWYEQDSDAALEWLGSGLQGDTYDRAASEIIFLLSSKDAYQAFELATSVSSAVPRAQALNGIIASASEHQLQFFINKIETGDFTADERIGLLKKIEQKQAKL